MPLREKLQQYINQMPGIAFFSSKLSQALHRSPIFIFTKYTTSSYSFPKASNMSNARAKFDKQDSITTDDLPQGSDTVDDRYTKPP
jgi:hypothetical protein